MIDRHIQNEKKNENDRAEYGKHVVQQLAQDLGFSRTTLYATLQFARIYPIVQISGQLTWSHYVQLLEVKDDALRQALEKQAIELGWTSPELGEKINELEDNNEPGPKILRPKQGKLRTYRVIQWSASPAPLYLDLGFSTYLQIPENFSAGLKDGGIVEAHSLDQITKRPLATEDDLYTYLAHLERVVDGDTLWMRIDLGFGTWVRQKLRLRGIDCPELGTPDGDAAKEFVEDRLKTASELLIITTKPDKYDRYLSDVFIPDIPNPTVGISRHSEGGRRPTEESQNEILRFAQDDTKQIPKSILVSSDTSGYTFLNQLLLDRDLAHLKFSVSARDWGE